MRLIVGITGASGIVIAVEFLKKLKELEKLDNNETINPLYIGYAISLYGNDIKKVADFYIERYCK